MNIKQSVILLYLHINIQFIYVQCTCIVKAFLISIFKIKILFSSFQVLPSGLAVSTLGLNLEIQKDTSRDGRIHLTCTASLPPVQGDKVVISSKLYHQMTGYVKPLQHHTRRQGIYQLKITPWQDTSHMYSIVTTCTRRQGIYQFKITPIDGKIHLTCSPITISSKLLHQMAN